jgi:hypothetical protein
VVLFYRIVSPFGFTIANPLSPSVIANPEGEAIQEHGAIWIVLSFGFMMTVYVSVVTAVLFVLLS